jgi:polysaccharide biosynthesis transport protein
LAWGEIPSGRSDGKSGTIGERGVALKGHDESGLAHYLRVLRRGAWLIVLTTVVVTGLAVYLSLRQTRLYEASADVFLNTQNLAASLSNIQPIYVDPQRAAETQASLARVPAVADKAVRAAGIRGRSGSQLLAESSVTPAPSADLLTFSVTDESRPLAVKLATAYAKAYTDYRRQLDTTSFIQARQEIEKRISQLRATGDQRSAIYASLVEKDQQLRTSELLQNSNAALVRQASDAAQVQPRPKRNAILAAVLGLMLGIGLAFLRDALNTRVRSAAEIQERLDLPLLGRVPEPSRRRRKRLTMVDDPRAAEAEAYRILATNLDFVNLDRGAASIMITSSSRGEGKSTTIANLAAAFARSGRRVTLIDLDLRRPSLASLFGLDDDVGLTELALGRATLDDVLYRIPVLEPDSEMARVSTNGSGPGSLDVLPAGPLPPNPAEFAGSHALSEILHELSERVDLVLIDAPPILQVSDAMTLSAKVDAIMVVARLPDVRRGALDELRRVLDAAPVVKLGFVVTGMTSDETYGYGYGYGYGYASGGRKERERVR